MWWGKGGMFVNGGKFFVEVVEWFFVSAQACEEEDYSRLVLVGWG